ncbi:hypothetical protein [Pandoravirus japonicus]|uniref:Uncharacterized protein n=1 Tax=Pandoravirus japonicus TaxID=2823154 RepID=A0A811BMB5_9VIRU|nr:hypothetical protein [Pandoravirus japonicus]
MQCTLSLCPSSLHKTPAPKRPRQTDRSRGHDRPVPKRPRTMAVAIGRPTTTKILCRGRTDHRQRSPAGCVPVLQRPTAPAERASADLGRLSIMLDYLATLVANEQCEAFGIVIDGTHPCRLTVSRASLFGTSIVWTLQSSRDDISAVVGAVDAVTVEREVRDASYLLSEMPAIVSTRLAEGVCSDAGSVSVIYRRWAEARSARDSACDGSHLWVHMNGLGRSHSTASTRALGVLATGPDRQWIYTRSLAVVEVSLDQAWDNWDDNAIRLAAEYLQSLSLSLAAQMSGGRALTVGHCLHVAS